MGSSILKVTWKFQTWQPAKKATKNTTITTIYSIYSIQNTPVPRVIAWLCVCFSPFNPQLKTWQRGCWFLHIQHHTTHTHTPLQERCGNIEETALNQSLGSNQPPLMHGRTHLLCREDGESEAFSGFEVIDEGLIPRAPGLTPLRRWLGWVPGGGFNPPNLRRWARSPRA